MHLSEFFAPGNISGTVQVCFAVIWQQLIVVNCGVKVLVLWVKVLAANAHQEKKKNLLMLSII